LPDHAQDASLDGAQEADRVALLERAGRDRGQLGAGGVRAAEPLAEVEG
jgi:hypothetical protein